MSLKLLKSVFSGEGTGRRGYLYRVSRLRARLSLFQIGTRDIWIVEISGYSIALGVSRMVASLILNDYVRNPGTQSRHKQYINY